MSVSHELIGSTISSLVNERKNILSEVYWSLFVIRLIASINLGSKSAQNYFHEIRTCFVYNSHLKTTVSLFLLLKAFLFV